MRTLRPLYRVWQREAYPVTVEEIRRARAQLERNGAKVEAVLVRPDEAKTLPKAIDGLPVEPDGCVTPGTIYFAQAEAGG